MIKVTREAAEPSTAEEHETKFTRVELRSLKAAKIILDAGWTYKSNPRFRDNRSLAEGSRLTEIDFIADCTVYNSDLDECLGKEGWLGLQLVIDVKKYSRPLLIFSSPLTDQDNNFVYSDVYCTSKSGKMKNAFCSLHWRDGPFGGDYGGRSAVVVNNDGTKPKDFDVRQIYSALDGLYEACKSVKREADEFYRFVIEDSGQNYLNAIIPVIIYDGDILVYRITSRNTVLERTNVASLTSHIIGEEDRLSTSCAFVVSLTYL
jgi:hypothetical protein